MIVVAACAAAGWALRGALGHESPPHARPQTVDLGAITLQAPRDWGPARPADAGVEGLGDPVAAFATTPGLPAYAVVALAQADDRSLVAAPLRAVLGSPGRSRRTRLAGLPARSFPARPIAGDRTATVTVAATPAGVVTVLCVAPTVSWLAAFGCADELRAGGDQAPDADLPASAQRPAVEPDAGLTRALSRLDAERADLRTKLTRTRKPTRLASLALRLGRIHQAAAATVARGRASARDQELVRTLGTVAGLYKRLAAAATGDRPAVYTRARRAIMASDATLERTETALR